MSTSPARRSPAPGSTASLRAANQRRVLSLLLTDGGDAPWTQAEIARTTQLAPATVSNIVRDLSASGLVQTTLGSGRRGTTVEVSRRAGLAVGVDVGYRHLRVALGDFKGAVLGYERATIDIDASCEEALSLVSRMTESVLGATGADASLVRGAGLSVPAPVNSHGVVSSSTILPGWAGVNARAVATERLGVPVHVENDANLGALAEHRRGAGRGHCNVFFVKVSTGVGAGLVMDGELYRGASGLAGEVGHLTYDERGPLCRCGTRGCLEVYTSVGHVKEMIADRMPAASIDDIVLAAQQGDVAALRVFEDTGMRLGWGMAMVANLFNPSVVVIGGDLARAGSLYLDWVSAGIRRHALPPAAAAVTVSTAQLGSRASVIGALLHAIDRTELIPAHGIG